MLTGNYLVQFLDAFVVPFRAPNTAACYRRAFQSLPASVLRTELPAITGLQLQAAINQQARTHPRAAQLTYTALHVAMARAVALGLLARSPMEGCQKPQHHAAKAAVLTADQLAQYIQTARAEAAYPLLLLMATCGLRRGEALGLRWDAVDLAKGVLHIRVQRMRVHHGYQLRPLKSASSLRSLPLPAAVVRELAAIGVRSFSGYVCDMTPEALAKAHRRVLDRAGLPRVTPHGLRHSMATAAAAQGCPMKILQAILGHSKYELTANLYADHLDADALAPHLASLAVAVMG